MLLLLILMIKVIIIIKNTYSKNIITFIILWNYFFFRNSNIWIIQICLIFEVRVLRFKNIYYLKFAKF